MYLAELYWGLGDAPRTEFCIRRVMQEYGDIRAAVFDALRFRARLYKSLGGMADAIQIYANLFRDYQDDPGRCLGAPVDIIKTYLEWGHYQPATEYLDSIDFARTDRYTGKQAGALALYYAATAHRMRDEFDMARPIYRQGITQYPGEPIAEIGKLMLGQADLDEIKKEWGAEDIEKCQVPDRAFDLAEWYLEHGEKKKARLWYQQVVKIDLKGDLWRVLAERRMEELEGKKKGKGE
jgi:tetratricopeptide (TPR) repeat protein